MEELRDMFPEDMLTEILSRLSVKTLVRFTCVCKQWSTLIRSPSFAMKQLATTRSYLFKDNFQFFFTIRNRAYMDCGINRNLASLISYDSFELCAKFEWSPCEAVFFSNPCDGIICVFVRRDELDDCKEALLLWNPSTREVEVLPYPLPPCIPPEGEYQGHFRYLFGFGYDPKSDDYKIFVIFRPFRDLADSDWPVEVYSLREGSWQFLPANSFHESLHSTRHAFDRCTLNGKICNWINEFQCDALISFDLTDETFLKTPLHERCIRSNAVLLQSNKVDAKLRVLCSHYSSYCPGDRCDIEIWELTEYGSTGCWSKQMVIEFQYCEKILGPLGYRRDEETLILQHFQGDGHGHVNGLPLLTYNADTKQLESTGFDRTFELHCGYAYIESLISVKERCREHKGLEHRQPADLGPVCTLREVHGPVPWLSCFPCSSVPWLDYC